jgi:hypothetical protein
MPALGVHELLTLNDGLLLLRSTGLISAQHYRSVQGRLLSRPSTVSVEDWQSSEIGRLSLSLLLATQARDPANYERGM